MKERPNMATVKEVGARLEDDSEDSSMSLENLRFNIAFAVTSKNSKFHLIKPLHDPEYINWWVSYKYYTEDGTKLRHELKTHRCT